LVALDLTAGLAVAGTGSAGADARLDLVRRTTLAKVAGRIDQIVPLPAGGFLVRDADLLKEASQALEVYDAAGRFVRKIGSYGPRPGSYQALKQIALSHDGTIWVADLIGRLSFFDLKGELAGTKLIQAPGFQVEGIALDEPRGLFYLSGCLPTHTYLDRGCKVIHQYSLKDRKFQRSFLDNDPQIAQKNLLSFSDNALDVDAQGLVWAVDAPVMKLSRVDPRTGKADAFSIRSTAAKPLSRIEPGTDTNILYQSSYLLDGVVTVAGAVVVSIRGPGPQGSSLLEVFDPQGRQIAVDLKPPGRLVGKTVSGHLLFASPVKGGFEAGEYALGTNPTGKRPS
jgi:hypothetical protein